MNFWSNPENNSLKTIFIVALVVGLGYFVYHGVQSTSLTGKGSVIDSNTTVGREGYTFAVSVYGPICTMDVCVKNNPSQCIPLTGITGAGGMCNLDNLQPSPSAQKLLEAISSKKTQ
jgi:hypothetical protein